MTLEQIKSEAEFGMSVKECGCCCASCRAACTVAPCWPTMQEAVRLILAGYARRLSFVYHQGIYILTPAVSGHDGKPYPPQSFKLWPILMVRGRCTMHTSAGGCALHDQRFEGKKLKPLEGRMVSHDAANLAEVTAIQARVIVASWNTLEGQTLCHLWNDITLIGDREMLDEPGMRAKLRRLSKRNERTMRDKAA